MARVAIEATKFGDLTAAYSWARSSIEKNQNDVAKRIIYWITEEDKKRTNFARMRGEIEALDPIKDKAGKAGVPAKSDQKLESDAAEILKAKEKLGVPTKEDASRGK